LSKGWTIFQKIVRSLELSPSARPRDDAGHVVIEFPRSVPVHSEFESRTTGAALALKRVGVVLTIRRERGRDVLKAQFEDGREATFVDRTEFKAGEESYQALGWQRDQYRLRDLRTGEIQALTRNAPR
jgi:hypothetical protein